MTTEIALELALRLRAEMEQGLAALSQLEDGVEGVQDKSREANAELGKVGGAAGEIEKVAAASQRASQGLTSAGETAEEAEERIRRMVQASVEYRQAQDAQLAAEQAAAQATQESSRATAEQAAEIQRVTQAAYESQAAITAQMRSMGELADRVERGARSLEDLADIEREMDRLMAAGLLTETEQLEMMEKLDRQEKQLLSTRQREEQQLQQLLKAYDPAATALRRLEQNERKLKQAVDEGRISREQYLRAMTGLKAERAQWEAINEGVSKTAESLGRVRLSANEVARSLASATSNAARGNVSGAGHSLSTLGMRGAASFGTLGLAIGGVVAALGLFTLAAWRGYQQSQELDRALIATGNSAGVTAGEVEQMSAEIDYATGRFGRGREALLALVQAGDVAGDVLADAGLAAVNLAELTGRGIDQTTSEIRRLMEEPARYAAELNKQYGFLTASVYNQVRALEAQGRQQEAVRLVLSQLASDSSTKMAQIEENIGWIEQAWNATARALAWYRELLLGLGRDSTAEQELKNLSHQMSILDAQRRELLEINPDANAAAAEKVAEKILALQDRYVAVARQMNQERLDADEAAAERQAENAAIAAEGRQAAALGQDRQIAKAQELRQLERDIAALRARNITEVEGMSLADLEAKRRAQIEERFKDRKTPKSEAEKEIEQQRRFVEQLERQAAVYGLNAQQLREYELAERKLTGALLERAQAAAEVLRLAEEQRSIEEDAQSLAAAQTAYLRAIGRHQEAAERELEQRYGELLERLERRGDEAGTAIIGNLFSVEKARAALQQLQTESDRVMGSIARAEQRVGVERDAGLISNIEAQRRLLALREREIQHLQQQIPLLREQAAILQDPALLAALDEMELRLFELQNQAGLFTTTLRNGLETGIADGLRSLADGTATVGEAVRGVVSDLAGAFADLAAQQLAAWATYQIMSRIGGDGPDVGQPDPAQAAAAGTAYAAPIAGAATALTGATTAMGTTAATLTATGPTLMSAAAAIAASAAQLQAAATALMVANSMSAASGFASGGWTGPGSKYSFAGYVHADEWVHPKESVGYYGHGVMRALQHRLVPRELFAGVRAPTVASAPRVSFAEGGLARGEMPAPQVSVGVINQLRGEQLVEALGGSREFTNLVVNTMIENKRTFEAS